MKLSNTQWILVATVLAVAIWYFFLREKESKESSYVKTICKLNNKKLHDGPCKSTDPKKALTTYVFS